MKKADDKRVMFFRTHFLDLLRQAETQKWVAAESGVQQSTISHIKNNARKTTEETMAKIAKAFGLDLEEFIEIGKRKFYERGMITSEEKPEYGPAQYNFFGNRSSDLQPADDYMRQYPMMGRYLDAFKSACKVGSKKMMLVTLDELRDYIEGRNEGESPGG